MIANIWQLIANAAKFVIIDNTNNTTEIPPPSHPHGDIIGKTLA